MLVRNMLTCCAAILVPNLGVAATYTFDYDLRLSEGLTGQSLPGLLSFAEPVVNDLGTVAVLAKFDNGAGSIQDRVLRIDIDGIVTEIARDGNVAPGSGGQTFASLGIGVPIGGGLAINNAGQVAFAADLTGSDSGSNYGIYKGSGGAVSEVMQYGDIAPGTGGQIYRTFDDPFLRTIQPSIDDDGNVYFETTSIVPDSIPKTAGIFRVGPAGDTRLVTVETPATDGVTTVDFPIGDPRR